MRRRPSGRTRSRGRASARAITDRNPSTTLFSVMVLVRGACGQIGSRLCTLLRTAGPLAHNLAPLSLRCSIWPAWVLFLAPTVLPAQASSRPCSAWCLSQPAAVLGGEWHRVIRRQPHLYVAFVEGIARIDVRARAIARLPLLAPGSTAAI